MSGTIVELKEEFIEERAVEALEGLSLFLASDPEIINSMSAEEVIEQLEALDVPASTGSFEEMMCLIRRHDAFGDYPEGSELDVENDIVVRMSPIKRQKVKLHVKNSGRAKLRVVHDPLPDE